MIVKKNYGPRLLLVISTFFLLYSIVAIRLFLIQVYQREFFQVLAKQQYVTEITTQPARALIYDRNGDPLAINTEKLSAFIVPHQFKESEKTVHFLKKHYKHIYKKMKKEKKRRFFWLERHLSDGRVEEIKRFNLQDVYFLAEPERYYPFNSAAHIVGFTDIDNVGIAGIEFQFNNWIGGTPTTFMIEKDARSGYFYFQKEVKEQGLLGDPVTLTIDKNLQFLAYEELEKSVREHGAKGGSALILDPDTGHILAMASSPGFDPNKKEITALEETKNIGVTECFELGSVMKVFTALVALEENVATFDEEIDCMGKGGYIDGFKVENWKSLGEGTHPFWLSFARSSNVAPAKIAKRLGPMLYHHLRRLGFGKFSGIRFPGERSGFINPPHKWSRSSIIVLSFGYEIMSTLLQLGKAFSIIANGGYDIQPVLVSGPKRKKTVGHSNRLYSSDVIEQVKEIFELRAWMKDRYSIDGYRIMGKTGTARSVKDGKYSQKDHVYTYGGIIEKEGYRRVIITFIKEPKRAHIWASQLTLPLFHSIAQKMIVYDLLKKKGDKDEARS